MLPPPIWQYMAHVWLLPQAKGTADPKKHYAEGPVTAWHLREAKWLVVSFLNTNAET